MTMTARISKDFALSAGIHYEGKYIINNYLLKLHMDVTTEDMREQNIALDRIKYLLEECFDSCVFVDQQDIAALDNYSKAGMKVCTVPDGPYDQIIGAVLLSKFNAVTEHKLFVDEIVISSRICDDVDFYISSEEDMPVSTVGSYWWKENNTLISDWVIKPSKKEKIVELKKEIPDWVNLGLTWKPKAKAKNSKVVFIDSDHSQPN